MLSSTGDNMATFVDLDTSIDESETVQEPVVDSFEQDVKEEPPEEVPEKYRGKSINDIVKMHQEAEKLIGRQGSEVGELRHIVDDFIRSQTVTPQEATVEDIDYFTDPQKAVQSQIDSHPAIQQARNAAIAMQRAETLGKLKQEHPDYIEVVNDPSFAEWVQGSRVRAELFARADQGFDFDSANELLTNWKERKELGRKMTDVSAVDRKQQLKAATTSISGSSDEGVGKKIYRRADIIKLMQTDPERYDAMQNEIMAAYREGRVK
jgi:hypothetical protein